MKIGITGASGFIGWHLRCYLKTLEGIAEIRIADRSTFNSTTLLTGFVHGLDVIFHLAGVNRADDSELVQGNTQPASLLVKSLEAVNSCACIVYSSSTYAVDKEGPYGQGKSAAGMLLSSWSKKSKGRFVNAVIPHVFGEYGRPFYNSAIATFCSQIINQETLKVNPNGKVELVHVQNLAEQLLTLAQGDDYGDVRIVGEKISMPAIVNLLQGLYTEYVGHNRLPDLSSDFNRSLFNTLRSFIPNANRVVYPTEHTDDRGSLVETIKAGSGGQCFVSSTKPGVTRGNHFHRKKVERFFVLHGEAKIQLRKLFSDEVIIYELSGDRLSYLDIPTLHTHSITNVGSSDLVTLFWADEFYDPNASDTYIENVIVNK